MNIDERLEALVQTVELLAALHRDLEKGMTSKIEVLTDKMEVLTDKMEVLTERTKQAMDSINRLGHIAGLHDARIDDHEERIGDLEGHGS
jgi:hypothetical protein